MGSHGTPWRSCLVCLLAASTWAGVAARLAPSLNASADLLDLDAPHEWQPCARGLHTSDMTLCFLGGALCPAPLFGEEGPLGLTAPFHRRDPHKDLFPLNLRDIIGLTLASLALALAASGGLGGGGILVPLYLIVLSELLLLRPMSGGGQHSRSWLHDKCPTFSTLLPIEPALHPAFISQRSPPPVPFLSHQGLTPTARWRCPM